MSALNEHGSYEEQQQRLYQLASSMGVPTHGECLDVKARVRLIALISDVLYIHSPSVTQLTTGD